MLAPVAIPSSTRITVLPGDVDRRPAAAVGAARGDGVPSVSRSIAVRSCSSLMPRLRTRLSLTTTPPPVASAPIASSCHCGTPSLRTRNTSSGACRNDGDLPPDGHAAARQAEHQQVVLAAVGRQLLSQDLAGFAAVPEGAPRISSGEPAPSAHRGHFRYRGHLSAYDRGYPAWGNPIAAAATNIYDGVTERRTMGIEYESVVDHPLAEVFAWHTRPGAMTRLVPPWQPMTVVAETESLADGRAVLGLPGGLRWVAQHDPRLSTRRTGSSTNCRRQGPRSWPPRIVGWWRHTHEFSEAPGGTRVYDHVDTSVPAAALRPTFVYRHRQLVRRSGRTPRGRRRRARSRWSSRSPARRAWSAPRCRRS